ncbi:hypothetical protein GOV12_07010 [Candidatus Pacearchaeota archaeon]|nr:hypothetical protein [Candidatus Pacearchaeota archaeon]
MKNKKILLVDVDSKIPNLVLMKISTYHKKKENSVKLKKLNYVYYPDKKKNKITIDGAKYNKVYVSIIFDTNKDKVNIINCDDVEFGGTGYDLTVKLPQEIDDCKEDYSIYPDNEISYGFITRGCIRQCKFCVVPRKEGVIHKYRKVEDIIKHKKVKFLDNNIFAFKDCNDILQELIDLKVRCQFHQGLDIRLIDDEKAKLISQLNYIPEYIFAFDNINDENLINKKLKIIKKYIPDDWKLKFYIYCHPDQDIFNDLLYRINWCKKNKVLPYLMRDISCWNSKNCKFYVDLAGWCNQAGLFKKMDFGKFLLKRHLNEDSIFRVIISKNISVGKDILVKKRMKGGLKENE